MDAHSRANMWLYLPYNYTAVTSPVEHRTFVIMYHTHGAVELLLSERISDQRLGDGAYRWAPDHIQTEM